MKIGRSFPRKTFFVLLSLSICFLLQAQPINNTVSYQYTAVNSANRLQQQADSLKSQYEKDGFVMIREAEITMESEYEMPVIVALTQGTWYQFVYIGDETSSLHEVRMYDWDEKQVIYQKRYGSSDGNIISYSYIPKFSEYHMMKPVQVNKKKKKDLKGYVMLFKKTQ